MGLGRGPTGDIATAGADIASAVMAAGGITGAMAEGFTVAAVDVPILPDAVERWAVDVQRVGMCSRMGLAEAGMRAAGRLMRLRLAAEDMPAVVDMPRVAADMAAAAVDMRAVVVDIGRLGGS